MRAMFRIFAVLMATAASATAALADGTSIKDGPAPVADARTCDGGPFAGFYVGAAVGYGGQDTTATSGLGGSLGDDDNGFAGSLYSGYNIQCGRLVVGYESDYNWMDTDGSFGDGCPDCGRFESDIKWFGSSRMRIGLVHSGNILFYATGGIAYADIDTTFAVPALDFRSTRDDWHFGWTAGGGVEFIRHGQWSLRAEALYADLGDKQYGYSDANCGIDCTGSLDWENELWIARVGLTYRLGARAEVAAPLK